MLVATVHEIVSLLGFYWIFLPAVRWWISQRNPNYTDGYCPLGKQHPNYTAFPSTLRALYQSNEIQESPVVLSSLPRWQKCRLENLLKFSTSSLPGCSPRNQDSPAINKSKLNQYWLKYYYDYYYLIYLLYGATALVELWPLSNESFFITFNSSYTYFLLRGSNLTHWSNPVHSWFPPLSLATDVTDSTLGKSGFG